MDKKDKRTYIQALGALALNGQLRNFFQGKIYQGPLKSICLPVLNCYSCPGALGACPIGSLQALSSGSKGGLAYLVLGSLIFYGLMLGRWFCGFLCPFGFYQDLLSKIGVKKVKIPKKIHRLLSNFKYLILLILIFLLPLLSGSWIFFRSPIFCKYLCPSGTLFAGIPLLGTNPLLAQSIGSLFYSKLSIGIFISLISLIIPRVFCRYLCPLGAFLGLLNPHSLYFMTYDKSSCISCGQCVKKCPMEIDPKKTPNSPQCIRCKECNNTCPTQSLAFGTNKNRS